MSSATYAAGPAQKLILRRAELLNLSLTDLADILRLPRRTLVRLLSQPRLRWDTADRVAVALGYHPSEIWPTWNPKIEESRA